MKRITLMTAIGLVIGMMTATAAAADPGPRDDAGQPDAIQQQVPTHEQVGGSNTACQTDECEPVRQQTRDRDQIREHDAACRADDASADCEPARQQTRDRDQIREHDAACRADDVSGDCEPVRQRVRDAERIWERLLESTDWGTEYRSVARWMWQIFARPFAALSFSE